jgi:hypothetical protein
MRNRGVVLGRVDPGGGNRFGPAGRRRPKLRRPDIQIVRTLEDFVKPKRFLLFGLSFHVATIALARFYFALCFPATIGG